MTDAEPITWRILLGRLIADPHERVRVASALGVNPVTLVRWTADKSHPRSDSLRQLPRIFPEYRQQFIELIQAEIPNFFNDEGTTEEPVSDIPSAFYSNVLRTYTNSLPQLRPSIRIIILQQLLTHLDPSYLGLAVSLCLCVTPEPQQCVRSLREVLGRANPPWHSHLENRTQFLGVESLPGNAVSHGRPVIMPNRSTKDVLFPNHIVEWEESALAYPIVSSNRIAGCLYLSSTLQDFFTEVRQELVRGYIDLLSLTFEQNEFYALADIELGMMPPYRFQRSYLKQFQLLVSQYIKDIQGKQLVTRYDAEQAVLRLIETELLHLRYNEDEQSEQPAT